MSADIQATDRLRIRWCIVKAQSVLAGRVPLLEMEECVLAADTLRDTCGVRNSVFVGNYLNLQSVCENVLVVAAYGVYLHGTAEVRCSTISRLLSVQRTAQGSGVLDCVISSIEAGTSNVRIENCDVYGKTPYVGLAKKGPGCMELDPQFVDPMNLNYRLKPTSPCRNRASDGGDLGFRYTPEIQEVLDKALELRAKGIIKF